MDARSFMWENIIEVAVGCRTRTSLMIVKLGLARLHIDSKGIGLTLVWRWGDVGETLPKLVFLKNRQNLQRFQF